MAQDVQNTNIFFLLVTKATYLKSPELLDAFEMYQVGFGDVELRRGRCRGLSHSMLAVELVSRFL